MVGPAAELASVGLNHRCTHDPLPAPSSGFASDGDATSITLSIAKRHPLAL